jgi:hypothetical protein
MDEHVGLPSPNRALPGLHRVDDRSRALPRALVAAALGLLALGPWSLAGGPAAEAKEGGGKSVFEHGCRVQPPQKFLKRSAFIIKGVTHGQKQIRAARYLAERYGHAGDEVTQRWNAQSARAQAKTVRFMGLPVSIHAKIAPALACVEKRLAKTCRGASRYTPRAVGGFRGANTYRGAEISNHLFGIAIDIDPDRNPCCGCVDPWPSHPLCKVKSSDVYERTALPKCWVRSFERFGFHWLGHDELEDTMHFEFLGDPERIKRVPPAARARPKKAGR